MYRFLIHRDIEFLYGFALIKTHVSEHFEESKYKKGYNQRLIALNLT